MADLAAFERQVISSVSRKVHERLGKAREARLDPAVFGDPEEVADAMVAALPLGHVFDDISGPFYDTAGVTRWLGISRQALHQKVARHAMLACPLDDGGLVYPVWQFLPSGAPIPGLTDALAALSRGADDPWMAALWMRAPSDLLDGLRPSDWLRAGRDPDRVISIARDVASHWRI